jgi:hypothetical protein
MSYWRDDRLPDYPVLTQMDKERIRAEILANCDAVGDCWVFQGALNSDGYGMKHMGTKLHSVSRFMLAYHTRESMNVRFDACHDTALCPELAACLRFVRHGIPWAGRLAHPG